MTQTWFITGASSGFGRILTEKLLARGDRVLATVRKPIDLQHENLTFLTLDLTSGDAAIRKVVDDAFAKGRIDVIVSNAGYGMLGAAEEATDAQVRHIVETNLFGSITLVRAALPYLRKQGGGRVLQLSSAGGQNTYPGFSLYHATKWGIEGFIETVAQEMAPFGIEFTIVEPGATRTDFGKGLVLPTPMPEYDGTPADWVRKNALTGGWAINGDPVRMVDLILASAAQKSAPLRLALGSECYEHLTKALESRLAALRAQEATARAGDAQS